MTITSSTIPRRRRFRLFRFSLRTLLASCTVAAVLLGLKVNAVRQQRAVIADLARVHVSAHYDYQHRTHDPRQAALSQWGSNFAAPSLRKSESVAPGWLRELIGDDYFHDVTAVTLPSEDASDARAALPHLKRLPKLREIFLPTSGMCGLSLGPLQECQEMLERELPGVKVTIFSIVLPIVG